MRSVFSVWPPVSGSAAHLNTTASTLSPPPLGWSCSSPPPFISLYLPPASFSSLTASLLNFHDCSAFFWHTNVSPPSCFPFLHSSFLVYSLAIWLLLLFFYVLPITKSRKNNATGPGWILHGVSLWQHHRNRNSFSVLLLCFSPSTRHIFSQSLAKCVMRTSWFLTAQNSAELSAAANLVETASHLSATFARLVSADCLNVGLSARDWGKMRKQL